MTNSEQPTSQLARDEAAGVAHTAAQGGSQVGQTAGEQARRVAQETTRQARDLAQEGRAQLVDQARQGQQKAADSLRTLADQLQEMCDRTEGSGLAPEVVRQAAERTRTAASWLGDREPGALLDEVRTFARRRPGVFLAGAALAGVLAGRLTRGAVAGMQDSGAQSGGAQDGYPGSGYPGTGLRDNGRGAAGADRTMPAAPAVPPTMTPPPSPSPMPPADHGTPVPGPATTQQPGSYPGQGPVTR